MSVTALSERFNVRKTCQIFGIHPATLYRWKREGRINALRLGRRFSFTREEVERVLASSEERGKLTSSTTAA